MEYALIVTALTLGAVTSLHCVGMCGPIAFSLGLSQENQFNFITKNLTYQIGRVTTYTFLGVIVGVVGEGISFAGFQKYLSIIVGVLMILMVFLPKNLSNKINGKGIVSRALMKLKQQLGNFIRRKSYYSLFITGVLNGFLPCGAVYVALAAALGIGHVGGSAFFMTLFGLGTIPLMFITVLAGSTINLSIRNRIIRFLPVITVVIGIIFIVRGLELGIPYLSPPPSALEIQTAAEADGHHHCH